MALFQYVAYHPLQGTQIARLNVREPSWTEAVSANTVFSGKITIPDNPERISALKQALEPDEAALYVKGPRGRWLWGGLVVSQEWDSGANEVSFVAMDWRSYAYQLILGPELDGSADILYEYNGQDQLFIARNMAQTVIGPNRIDEGRPNFSFGTELSGQLRDLNFRGLDFRNLGQQIDSMAKRDNGFEWDVVIDTGPDGVPIPRLAFYYPEKGSEVVGLSFHDKNMLGRQPISKDSSGRKSRVWASGEGPVADSLPFAQDTDPSISDGFSILKETHTNWSGVVNIPTLGAHARGERDFLNKKMGIVTFSVSLSNPDFLIYSAGDRGGVRIRDRWYDLEESQVRILQRNILPDQGVVRLVMNLNDSQAPQSDEDLP